MNMNTKRSSAFRRLLAVLSIVALTGSLASPVFARGGGGGGGDGDSIFDYPRPSNRSLRAMEDYLRDLDPDDITLALYRTYLPFRGRRAVPLPSIEEFKRGRGQGELDLCPITRVLDERFINFSRVYDLLISREGDGVDFLVEMARALRVPVTLEPENDFPFCAWWGFVDERFFNWIFPDSVATYWFQPFIAPGRNNNNRDQWHLEGRFIRERYKSFALYDFAFNPFEWEAGGAYVNSTVTDFELIPVTGRSPWREKIPLLQYGTFKIIITSAPTRQDILSDDFNVIPFYSNVIESERFVRERAGIPLPLPCNRDDPDNTVTCPNEDMFQVPAAELEQGVVSNVNNAYVVSITKSLTVPLSEPRTQRPVALVIRGKVPLTPGSRQPPNNEACDTNILTSEDACYCQRNPDACQAVPWIRIPSQARNPGEPRYLGPRDREDRDLEMRYWSICTAVYNIPYPTIGNILPRNRLRENTGCVPDSDIIQTNKNGKPKPDGGWFTAVVSSEAAKPEVFKIDAAGGSRNTLVGANWIEGVEGVKILINLRNMYPSTNFDKSVGRVGADSSWVTAFNTMKKFYPVINAICPVERINKLGWGACIAPRIDDTCGRPDCDRFEETAIGPAGIASPSQGPNGMLQ